MSKRDNIILLEDIIEAIEHINEYIAGLSHDDFLADRKTQDAVARNFEIMGEAVARMTSDFKQKHAHINWLDIKDFRNILIHSYELIDNSIVWNIASQKLPIAFKQIADLLASYKR